MKNNMSDKNKKLISAIISLVVGLGVSGMSHGGTSTDAKSGSFKYVVPSGMSNMNACPGPYESLAITTQNRTNYQYEWYGDHGRPLAVNVMYVLNDKREYTGNFIKTETDLSQYPVERKGHNSPSGLAARIANYPAADVSGPVTGALLRKNVAQQPVRSWSDTKSDYPSLAKKYGESNLNVLTEITEHGDDTYMDYIDRAPITMRIPIRNYKMLHIEVVSGATDYNVPNWLSKIMVWEGESISSEDGTRLKVTRSELYNKKDGTTFGTYKAIPGMAVGSTVDLLSLDNIAILAKGDFNDAMYTNSSMSFNKLKNTKTGKDVNCH